MPCCATAKLVGEQPVLSISKASMARRFFLLEVWHCDRQRLLGRFSSRVPASSGLTPSNAALQSRPAKSVGFIIFSDFIDFAAASTSGIGLPPPFPRRS